MACVYSTGLYGEREKDEVYSADAEISEDWKFGDVYGVLEHSF